MSIFACLPWHHECPSFRVLACAKNRDAWFGAFLSVVSPTATTLVSWSTCRVFGKMRLPSAAASPWSPWCFIAPAGDGPGNSMSWSFPSTVLGAKITTVAGPWFNGGISYLVWQRYVIVIHCGRKTCKFANSKWITCQIPAFFISLWVFMLIYFTHYRPSASCWFSWKLVQHGQHLAPAGPDEFLNEWIQELGHTPNHPSLHWFPYWNHQTQAIYSI